MITRRTFIRQAASFAAGSVLLPSFIDFQSTAGSKITILYTNDTHARLEPFPKNATQYAGLGGIAKRANLIRKIRDLEKNVLLLDAGDVFQGTPWFDVYGGEVDLKIMSEIQYDAMAVGNHEFDLGLQALAEAAENASFPILAANYNVRNTPLAEVVRPFIVKEMANVKVGIFGLGIGLPGIVDPKLYGGVQSRDPEIWAKGMVTSLRRYHNCDIIICVSHIGYEYSDSRVDDITIARRVGGIDLIIGGHTHTFLDKPARMINPEGTRTLVTQMGHSGIRLGRIDINLEVFLENQLSGVSADYYTIGE